jgi:hypothetical protein
VSGGLSNRPRPSFSVWVGRLGQGAQFRSVIEDEHENENENENDRRVRGHPFLGTTWESLGAARGR